MFLGWMTKNRNSPQARQYTYVEFPQHYTWIAKEKVSDVSSPWKKNWHLLSDDIQTLRRQQVNLPDLQISSDDQQNICLLEIEKLLRKFGKSLSDFPGMPIPTSDPFDNLDNSLLAQEMQYDHVAQATQFQREIIKFNVDQKVAFDEIMVSMLSNQHRLFFIDGTLRDVMSMVNNDNENLPFGGSTVVFGGDFRQTLPVIPKATRTEIVNSSIKRSYLWAGMKVIKLCQNMRLHREGCTSCEADEIQSFSKWIVDTGDGVSSIVYGDSDVLIPSYIMVEQNDDPFADIVKAIYFDVHEKYANPTYFADRAILAPLHEIMSSINDHMLTEFLGEETCYYSSDTIQSDGEQLDMLEAEFPTQFLNSMKIGNFPSHELKLKVGAPIILLRNIDQSTGFCNGTRLIIKRLGSRSVEVEVLTGSHAVPKGGDSTTPIRYLFYSAPFSHRTRTTLAMKIHGIDELSTQLNQPAIQARVSRL
ncbi:hypothetical protein LINPERPRIM_LOCUS10927 [Linum perenne]